MSKLVAVHGRARGRPLPAVAAWLTVLQVLEQCPGTHPAPPHVLQPQSPRNTREWQCVLPSAPLMTPGSRGVYLLRTPTSEIVCCVGTAAGSQEEFPHSPFSCVVVFSNLFAEWRLCKSLRSDVDFCVWFNTSC